MRDSELIVGLYEAFGRGDVPAVVALLAPDVEWHEAEGSPYQPDGTAWIGPDAVVANLFARMGEDWAEFEVRPARLHEADGVVTMEGRYAGRHRSTGKALDCQVCHVWTVEDGRVVRFQQYVDTARMQDVMGVPGRGDSQRDPAGLPAID